MCRPDRQLAQHGVLGGHAAGEREAVPRAFERREARLERGRVGLPVRAYSKPWCSPTPSCANVVASVIGVTTAPVRGSGSWPAWIARVSNPRVRRDCVGRARLPGGRSAG